MTMVLRFLRSAFLAHAIISMRRIQVRARRSRACTSARRAIWRAQYAPCFSRLRLPAGAPRFPSCALAHLNLTFRRGTPSPSSDHQSLRHGKSRALRSIASRTLDDTDPRGDDCLASCVRAWRSFAPLRDRCRAIAAVRQPVPVARRRSTLSSRSLAQLNLISSKRRFNSDVLSGGPRERTPRANAVHAMSSHRSSRSKLRPDMGTPKTGFKTDSVHVLFQSGFGSDSV